MGRKTKLEPPSTSQYAEESQLHGEKCSLRARKSRDQGQNGLERPGTNSHDDSSGNLPLSSSSRCHLSPAQKAVVGAVLHPEIQGEDGQEEHTAATSTRPSKSTCGLNVTNPSDRLLG